MKETNQPAEVFNTMYKRSVLSNGLRIITGSMPEARSATISVYVGAGSRYEEDDEAGLSHFLEHMLFKGASRRPTARDISLAIDSFGGSHNAATDRELTVYYARVPLWATNTTIDILSDMIDAPTMDETELEKERLVILEELAGIEDSPPDLATILSDETLWPGQPLGRNIGGTPEICRQLSHQSVSDYFASQYVPENIVISVAGRIEHEQITEEVERWLGTKKSKPAASHRPAKPRNTTNRIQIHQKDSEQAHLCIAFPGFARNDPNRYSATLFNALLGEGMSSRLFLELREERALVYDVHSWLGEYKDAGSLTIYAGCDPESASLVARLCLEQFEHLINSIDEEELTKGKQMVKGHILLSSEDSRSIAAWLGGQELLMGKITTIEETIKQLDAVTIDDIRKVGRLLFQPDEATIAAVGPFKKNIFKELGL